MSKPLAGIKILDLTRVYAGPFATMILADMGAHVVKVEDRAGGDVMRNYGGFQRNGVNALFMGLNRGKQSVAVDYRSPAAQEFLKELALESDVMISNFRPGVTDKLGLSAAELHAAKPELVIASISGFGLDGPSAQDPAYDPIFQARSGIVSRQRETADTRPDLVRSFVSDKMGGMFAVTSVLGALIARDSGKRNQLIDISILDSSVYYAFADGLQELAFVGDDVAPGQIFAYQRLLHDTADGEIVYAVTSLKDRFRLASALGRGELNEDPRFSTTAEASKPVNYIGFIDEIGEALRTFTTAEAVARLREASVAVAQVTEPIGLLDDPHVSGTGTLIETEHPAGGKIRHPAYPATFERGRWSGPGPSPLLGEHTDEVLKSLGYDEARIAELRAAGVVA